jgi:hypothetical protein
MGGAVPARVASDAHAAAMRAVLCAALGSGFAAWVE